jgi:conjugal transfer pilus assembly protein TraB
LQGIATAAQGATGASEDAAVADIAQSALAAAGAGGVQQAASTLSEYYINRAEQYQPVISLHGGTNVELVFLEGVSLR